MQDLLFSALFHEAWVSIGANKLRTFLAMLGIVIGVGSVVLLLAVGEGSSQAVERSIESLGSNLLVINPGVSRIKGLNVSNIAHFSMQDVEAIADLPAIVAVAPATFPRQFQAAAGKRNWNAQVMGTTGDYFPVRNWEFIDGAPFDGDDVRLAKRVAVIGAGIADRLFPGESDVVGRTIRINESSFLVIGLLKAKGGGFGPSQDDTIFLPITTAKSRLWGQNMGSSIIQTINVQVDSRGDMDYAEYEITQLLRQRQHLSEAMDNDFSINNMTSIEQAASATTQALTMLLGAIASISLIVGGIGIMNIMLVTVAERTREIGIRKAIGATENQILLQFLLEAVIIACVGSVAGLMIGLGGGVAAERWFLLPVDYSVWSVVLALGVAAGVGVISGIYPAYKAARLQPIEALRTV